MPRRFETPTECEQAVCLLRSASDEAAQGIISPDTKRKILACLGFDSASIMGQENGHDPRMLDWQVLIQTPSSRERFEYWGKMYFFWKDNPDQYERTLRRLLNTYGGAFEMLRERVRGLLETADRVVDRFFTDLFPDKIHLAQECGVNEQVRDTNDVFELLRLIYESNDGRLRDNAAIIRYEAYRKLALGLLIRQTKENPRLKNRREDSDHFERHLLRDDTGLVNPLAEYQTVTVWFKSKSGKPGLSDVSLSAPRNGEWEKTRLYRFKISGQPNTLSKEKKEVTVWAFPGNKHEVDALETPHLTLAQKAQLKAQRTIINYKDIEAMALKNLRGSRVRDIMRCTILTRTPEDLNILNAILENALGSAVSRKKSAKRSDNHSSDPTYHGVTQVVEDLHNEGTDRNYFIEIRTGTLENLLVDRSEENIPASHRVYRQRRTLPIGEFLFPSPLYPKLAETIEARGRELKRKPA